MNEQPVSVPEHARIVTTEILERMGIPSVITAREGDDALRITIHTQDSALLIGKQGATLNALQLLVGLIVNRARTAKLKVILDAEGYRGRRQASLEATAQRVAEKAIATGKIMEIHTMSSYERRIIHMTLAPVAGVSTRSEGEGTSRRLLVIPDELGAASPLSDDGPAGRGPSRGGRAGQRPAERVEVVEVEDLPPEG